MLNLSTKSILKVTVPIMLGTFIQNIVLITDSILVNRLGTVEFGAANNAGLLYIVFFMILRGLGDGTQIQIAKEYGQNKLLDIKNTLSNSLVLQFILSCLIFSFLFFFKDSLLNLIVKSDEIRPKMVEFLDYRSWGIFFAGMQISLISFFIGIGKTRIIIYSTLLLALSNVFLDFGLIFGMFGLPEMGLKGAALASTIAEAITFIFLLSQLMINASYSNFKISFFNQKIVIFKTKLLLKLSSPLMLRGFLSLATWFVFFTLIEQMGENDLEASHVVRNLFFLTFIPIFGFGSATRTYVSFYNGRNEYSNIKRVQKKLIGLAILFYLAIFHGAILYPSYMIRFITDNPLIIDSASQILVIVFWSMLLYSIVNVYYNTVSALGKTMLALWIEVVAIILYLSSTYLVILKWHWSIVNIWYVEFIYFFTLGILSIAYLIYYNNQRIKNNE
jgi:MATE family multidrug resistance protein